MRPGGIGISPRATNNRSPTCPKPIHRRCHGLAALDVEREPSTARTIPSRVWNQVFRSRTSSRAIVMGRVHGFGSRVRVTGHGSRGTGSQAVRWQRLMSLGGKSNSTIAPTGSAPSGGAAPSARSPRRRGSRSPSRRGRDGRARGSRRPGRRLDGGTLRHLGISSSQSGRGSGIRNERAQQFKDLLFAGLADRLRRVAWTSRASTGVKK